MPSSRGGSRAARLGSTTAAVLWFAAASCTHAPSPTVAPKPNPRAERALASDLNRIFAAPVMEQGLWGVEVKSLDTGRVLYRLNARKLMMPASNMKIVTLAAAAEALGWDYRFKTTLESDAEIQDGALKGNLVVRGGGDVTINSRDNRARALFDEWAAALKAAGVTRIDGNIVGDASAFDGRGLGQGWSWDYLEAGYAAPSSALEFNENIATLTIRPGLKPGDPAGLELPPSTGLGLVHRVVTGEADSRTAITIERRLDGAWLDVAGSIAVGASPATREVAVANPALYFTHALTLALIERGIPVRGIPVVFERSILLEPLPRTAIVESQSPPLREIATTMMKVSQNLYAETLLKAIGATGGATGTTTAGRAAAQKIFEAWGIQPTSYVQADGSGLSRYDFVTPEMIVTLLERMHKDVRHRDAFVGTMPIAGKDGTISTRMRGTRAEGNAVAKTGSISNVRALSGYVKTRDGETLAFSILANNFTVPAATVTWITDLAVETLANYTNR
jgi:D-alanyl-D-alanine carboxypeptidase/D-alanyl-D-alanine-endopeptidase (penicillin-binding protein 4)